MFAVGSTELKASKLLNYGHIFLRSTLSMKVIYLIGRDKNRNKRAKIDKLNAVWVNKRSDKSVFLPQLWPLLINFGSQKFFSGDS